jgi:hypothetical protein
MKYHINPMLPITLHKAIQNEEIKKRTRHLNPFSEKDSWVRFQALFQVQNLSIISEVGKKQPNHGI